MCQIVIYRKGATPFDYFKSQCELADAANRDGSSIQIGSKIIKDISALDIAYLFDKYNDNDINNAVYHARISTGCNYQTMLHPFDIPGGYLFHNGTINGINSTAYHSDTAIFAQYLRNIDMNINDIARLHAIDKLCKFFPQFSGSRFVITNKICSKIIKIGDGWELLNNVECCGTGTTIPDYRKKYHYNSYEHNVV